MDHRYDLDFSPLFDTDLSRLDAFVLRATIWWCPEATWQARVGDFRILYRVEEHTVYLLRVIEGLANDGGHGAVTARKKWLKQSEIDARARKRIATKLSSLIRTFRGSPTAAKEILRGFVAARQMGMDLRPFEDRLAKNRKAFAGAA